MPVNEELVIFFGAEGEIAPAGLGAMLLPGPMGYKVKLTKAEIGESRKNKKNVGIRLSASVTAVATGGDEETVDKTTEMWVSLPDGKDFTEDTSTGRGNRARVAEIKSLFVAGGVSLENVHKLLKEGLTVKKLNAALAKIVGREITIYYQPPAAEGEGYPDVTFVAPDSVEGVMSGQIKPKKKGKKPARGALGGGQDKKDDDLFDDDGEKGGSGGGDSVDDFS